MKHRNFHTFKLFVEYIVETGLEHGMTQMCRAHHVSIKDIYLDTRGPTSHAGRLAVWWWLAYIIGKSGQEIARMFDRDPSSIHHSMSKLRHHAVTMDVPLTIDTVHRVARDMASSMQRATRLRRSTS